MSHFVVCISAATLVTAVVTTVLKYQRQPPYPDSRRVVISFLHDPLTQRVFHIPEKYVVANMMQRSKSNKVRLKILWEENKHYFLKIWTRTNKKKRDIFVEKLLGELWELLEPYSTYSRDMKAVLLPVLPLAEIAGNISEDTKCLQISMDTYLKGEFPRGGAPVCRAVLADAPDGLLAPKIDLEILSEAQEFILVLQDLSYSMFLMQLLQRYTQAATISVYISKLKDNIILSILCTGLIASILFLMMSDYYDGVMSNLD